MSYPFPGCYPGGDPFQYPFAGIPAPLPPASPPPPPDIPVAIDILDLPIASAPPNAVTLVGVQAVSGNTAAVQVPLSLIVQAVLSALGGGAPAGAIAMPEGGALQLPEGGVLTNP